MRFWIPSDLTGRQRFEPICSKKVIVALSVNKKDANRPIWRAFPRTVCKLFMTHYLWTNFKSKQPTDVSPGECPKGMGRRWRNVEFAVIPERGKST